MSNSIPDHLPAWQAPHLAWLASQGLPTRYDVPAGTVPVRADLRDAKLSGVKLSGANLRHAKLSGADLSRADFRGAVLCYANLSDANLSNANLGCADLSNTHLYDVNLSNANLTGASGLPDAPVVPDLHRRMEEVTRPDGALVMRDWHTCATAHCRAGWAIVLAGEAGEALEDRVGPCAAGALIYHASTGMIPDFFASDKDARTDIVACAEAVRS